MDDFDKIKTKRTVVRTMTSKLIRKIEEILSETCELTLVQKIETLEECYDQLLEKSDTLKKLDTDIEKYIESEKFESEFETCEEYQEKIIKWKGRVSKYLRECNRLKPDQNIGISNDKNIQNNEKNMVKLPKITINKYFGENTAWLEFWHQFESAIHTNESLSKIDKFNYLKSLLGGTALCAISGLSLTNQNYDKSIQILSDRFGRPDLVINAHMNKLLSIEPVRTSSNIKALRKMYDEVEIQIRNLESLGITSGTYGNLLCPILLKLLPEDLALEFSRKRKAKSEWDIKELVEFIQIETECREATVAINESKKNKNSVSNQNRGNYNKNNYISRNIPTASALNTVSNEIYCVYCEKVTNHKSEDCIIFSVSERKEILRRTGRCFVCLRKAHLAKFCRSKAESCSFCKKRHNKSICENNLKPEKETVVTTMSHSKKSETDSRNNILLLTCEVKIWNEPYSKLGRILLDGGSTRTFIDQKIVKYLKLPVVGEETLSVYAFGSIKPIKKKYRVIRVELRNSKDPSRSIQIEALETDNICYTPISIPDENVLNLMNAENLSVGLQSTGDGQDHIELLIGSDFYWKIVTGTIQRLNENLVAVETMFGWCVQGQSSLSSCKFENAMTMNVAALSDQEISAQLRLFWDLEALGIKEVDDKLESKELMGKFEKEIKFKDNRYEVSLPWKSDGEEPQDNYETAKRRFKSLTKRLNNNNWLCNNYKNIILEQLKEGIIEECPNNELDMKRTYYMPHQPVINNHKTTTKVRIVYDASSKENGCKSLNDCLLPGPNLNPNLLTIILKFREKEIAFCSDIEKAFLQISVAMEDKNFLRFFWIDENQSLDGNMKIMRFKRIPFGVCSSPYLLAATIKYHIRKYESEFQRVYNMLNNYLYVDDLFYGSDEVEEAYHLSTNAVKILGDAGMNLRKWKTNSNELRHIWSQSKIINQEEAPEESLKVLGINWNNDIDCLKLDITSLIESLEHNKNTKRFVLQTVAKIFDPVGFISPFVIRAKCLLQEMWEKGLQWDEELPADAVENWTRWCSEIKHLNDFMINRKYFQENMPINADSIQLHIFCDASPRAYGAVAYFRYQEGRKFKTSFVMSKTRVSPLKQLSLPRLELMSTVIGARIADYLKDVFQLLNSNFYLWTDSSIALHWIKGTTREWKSFVSNRVTEIKSYTDPQNWYHCRGKDNPADMLTRGETVLKLINSDMWWKGAPWLLLPDTLWPQNKLNPVDPETLKTEKRAKAETSMQVKCSVAIITEPLLDAERYSKLSRIYRVTAWIKRFIHNSRKHAERKIGPLTAMEISEAEIYWVKCIQSQYFGEELKQLLHGHQIGKESKLIEFNPELDANGLICVKGRLQFSNCEPREKHPWLIPSGIKYTELLISDAHNKLLHAGVADTLVEVRCKFWIVRGRQFVKSVLNKCLICKRYKVRPGVQVTAPLPADRVQESPPFSVTGIDFAGPLFTRENDGKHYILLCTCAVTRAIHLELVSNLSTETFLLALRRFVARRGLCSTIYSDNAKTYKRANLDLKEIWNNINHAKVSEFFGNAGIHWKFIVEHGAWWGGFWERMVRTVKTSLKKIIGKSSLSTDELGTILIEIESVINSRPITYVYSDPQEPSPLTPSHFLVGQRLTSLPPVTLHNGKFNSNRDQLTRRYNYRQKLLDQFWQRWRKEYMLTLMSANCVKPTKIARDFKKDDVVLLGDDRLPRNVWNLGRVLEVFPGRDGKVRSCLIKLKSGTVRRPVQLLYPLELSE